MLDKVKLGALVSAAVLVLGFFGVEITTGIEMQIVDVIWGLISIVTYFTTAYFVVERKKNLQKLKTR